jgi:hypothetical protein
MNMVLERLFALREGLRLMSLRNAKPTPTEKSATDRLTRDLEELRETTGQVVGSVFYGTMLRAMRESELKGKYGHGGRGEEIFAGQLHGILAERAGAATSGSIGEAVFHRLSHQQKLISKGKLDAEV